MTTYTVSTLGVQDDRGGRLVDQGDAGLKWSYDALEPKSRRKASPASTSAEDRVLPTGKRSRLSATTSDIVRNFSIASWMLRKHLDYVSRFSFHSRTKDRGLNRDIETLMTRDARPPRADVAARHRREKLFRIAEARRTIDGDTGLLKIRDGRLQGFESDRIRDPDERWKRANGDDGDNWVNGVRTDANGRARSYGLHRRGESGYGFEFDRVVSSRRMLLYGYFDRYATEQVRGVSPIVSALNPLRDVYENIDFALMKAKVQQMFALAFFRDADDAAGDITGGEDADGNEDKSGYEIDFGRGPVQLDLEPGDRAEFLESRHPSTEFQTFTELVIAVALKALDLPYSFYDESHTNFFGSRGAWLHYERSCQDKREDQIELRRQYTVWKYQTWIQDGELSLPRGWTIDDAAFEWVAEGMPWWDPAKEVRGDLLAIRAGLDNPQRIVKERGRGDLEDNLTAIAEAIKLARDIGDEILGEPLVLSFDAGPAPLEIEGNDK